MNQHPVPNKPYGFCGRKAPSKKERKKKERKKERTSERTSAFPFARSPLEPLQERVMQQLLWNKQGQSRCSSAHSLNFQTTVIQSPERSR